MKSDFESMIKQDTNPGRVELLEDSFVDFEGKEHRFLIAAISIPVIADGSEYENDPNEVYLSHLSHEVIEFPKVLSLGISICNPCDKWNPRIAYQMATGRARKHRDHALYVTEPGLINTKMVQALLKQEAEYIKNNPEKVIEGYLERKKRWEKRLNEFVNNDESKANA